MTDIKLKRAYDPSSSTDGYRIYVDRLWPRGLSHDNFHYDLWEKEISPSTGLREWFHEDPDERWTEFESKYAAELNSNPAFKNLVDVVRTHPVVTLLYSSHDRVHDNAQVLKNELDKALGNG